MNDRFIAPVLSKRKAPAAPRKPFSARNICGVSESAPVRLAGDGADVLLFDLPG